MADLGRLSVATIRNRLPDRIRSFQRSQTAASGFRVRLLVQAAGINFFTSISPRWLAFVPLQLPYFGNDVLAASELVLTPLRLVIPQRECVKY